MVDCDVYVTRSLNVYAYVSSSASSDDDDNFVADYDDDDDDDIDCNAKAFLFISVTLMQQCNIASWAASDSHDPSRSLSLLIKVVPSTRVPS